MKLAIVLSPFLFITALAQQPLSITLGKLVDLSYAYDSTTIYWPTERGFIFEKGFEGITPGGWFYTANRFWTPEHGGTHIDAPIHFWKEGRSLDQIPVEQLIGPGIVVDVTDRCQSNRDYRVDVSDFQTWEQAHGRIPDGAIVLLRTGYSKYWPNRIQYMGTDKRGDSAVALLHFPGLHPDGARWIATERKIRAIGLDTPSIDYGQSKDFACHVILFSHDIPALENVADMSRLPAVGLTVVALPMKIKGGSGGPVRIVAILPS